MEAFEKLASFTASCAHMHITVMAFIHSISAFSNLLFRADGENVAKTLVWTGSIFDGNKSLLKRISVEVA